MKKKWIQLCVIIVSITMLFTFLVSCNGGDTSSSETSSNTGITSDTSDGSAESVEASIESEEESGGFNVDISLPVDSSENASNISGNTSGSTAGSSSAASKAPTNTPAKSSIYGKTIIISSWVSSSIPKLGNSDAEDASYYAFEWAKKTYNVKIEWKIAPESQYFAEYIQAALSGSKYSDIALVHSQEYLSWARDGLITPVTQYMKDRPSDRWNKTTFVLNGNLYAMQGKNRYPVPEYYLTYNTKMLKSLSLASPQELALNGQWTWGKFKEYCKKATNAATGTYGIHAFMLPDVMRYTNNIQACVYDNGKYYNGYSHGTGYDRTLEMMTFLQEMKVQDKSIMGEVTGGGDPMNEAFDKFVEGKLLFTFGRASELKRQEFADYGLVTYPVGPSGVAKPDNYLDGFSFWGISSASKYDPADLVNFFCDSLTTWEKSRGDAYYESSKDDAIDNYFLRYCLTRGDAEFMFKMGDGIKTSVSFSPFLLIGGIEVNEMFNPLLTNTSTPAAIIASTDNKIQAVIDGIFN